MPVPIAQMVTVASYLLRQKLRGRRRYPLVLMLEPLYRCNLACAGCGKIQYPKQVLKRQLSVAECMRAVDECGAPIVSLPGGEPLLHPQIGEIVAGLVERKKYVYLCTNALLLQEKLDLFEPSRYLTFSVHLDGLEAERDAAVCREGTWRTARSAIEAALARGFRVTTNSTFFAGADPERVRAFFDDTMALGVEGMMVSPGYSYDKAPDQNHFLERERTYELFRRLFSGRRRGWRFNQSPLFLEFLAGARNYDCTPWGNPTYGVFGWSRPCYLMQDGYARSFGELVEETRWEDYGPRSGNPKCRNCMVHSGFEASAVDHAFSSPRGMLAMLRATLFGPRIPGPSLAPGVAKLPRPTAAESGPSQGLVLNATPEALRQAFEYRGHVTLELEGGEHAEGYVANLHAMGLELWTKADGRPRSIPSVSVRRVIFSGRDTAAGASYEAWLRKRDEKQRLPLASA
jgi:hopanoid biosynthesis associated radical SAM protein HpnH